MKIIMTVRARARDDDDCRRHVCAYTRRASDNAGNYEISCMSNESRKKEPHANGNLMGRLREGITREARAAHSLFFRERERERKTCNNNGRGQMVRARSIASDVLIYRRKNAAEAAGLDIADKSRFR